ncbi:hypothetical protein LTR78_010577 [Recurvomyces mirabilis]|uniref:NACHT domain-containing protein n=1 Tax=Recurvomyces mirabilis TaxID=574656 RepID=A0AAE0TM49_9PEZI|nr:hypothetical protein LTR78_010577 [Recurvomyces mirabilis]KAK5150121.1 hypothetical protein LTS14_010384 [Recurvomyces mirabilis]
MRLLRVENLECRDFGINEAPKYVVASHRWVKGCEVSLQDIQDGRNKEKSGYRKVEEFAEFVRKHIPSVEWLWVDTCCINKESAAELSEAVNLMFDWYREAELCIALLADVNGQEKTEIFGQSEWFKRGWTLQELLAPRLVIFVTSSWQVIGHKGTSSLSGDETLAGPSLERDISKTTGIPEAALHDFRIDVEYSAEQKLTWMKGRSTTREEDMSYALYGICGVRPGANYGERAEGARRRLLAAINEDQHQATQKRARLRKIESWLSPPNPWTSHQSARRLHEPQTGTWLTRSAQFQNWKAASIRHLWLHGRAGCGKTILCSTAIEAVKAHCKGQPDAIYAVFYFSFAEKQKQQPEDLFRSLIVQLGESEPALSMLQQAYDKHGQSTLGLEQLEDMLLSSFQSYSTVFLLIDALDECPQDNDVRLIMLECLTRLSQKAPHVKIFITSRDSPNIRQSMAALGIESMAVGTHPVNEDIRRHVATQMTRDHRLSNLDQKTKALIEETIAMKADGIFRWASCQLQELKRLKSTKPRYIKATLQSLPATLDDTYERMLVEIGSLYAEEALTLLQWLAFSERPLTLRELAAATLIRASDYSMDTAESSPPEEILDVLCGLVHVDRCPKHDAETTFDLGAMDCTDCNRMSAIPSSTSTMERLYLRSFHVARKGCKIRLAHASVREYLVSDRIGKGKAKAYAVAEGTAQAFLAQSCFGYLLFYFDQAKCQSALRDDDYPLCAYAMRFGVYHQRAAENQVGYEGTISRLQVRVLQENRAIAKHLSSLKAFRGLDHSPDSLLHSILWNQTVPTLHLACLLGLPQTAVLLLSGEVDCRKTAEVRLLFMPGRSHSALHCAVWSGSLQIVKLLLSRGADVDIGSGLGESTPLCVACQLGHLHIVNVLLNQGATVNVNQGVVQQPLQAACVWNHDAIARRLLEAGADADVSVGYDDSPLSAACKHGNENLVNLLLDRGADINYRAGSDWTALHTASEGGCENAVKLLLQRNADTTAMTGDGMTALQLGCMRRHDGIVRLLLQDKDTIRPGRGDVSRSLTVLQGSWDDYEYYAEPVDSEDVAALARAEEQANAIRDLLLEAQVELGLP